MSDKNASNNQTDRKLKIIPNTKPKREYPFHKRRETKPKSVQARGLENAESAK